MAKQIKQFRYYQEGDSRNYPEFQITSMSLQTGKIFADYMPISQLGIQALPGTKFYLNNSYNPIIIGYTGVYELAINDLAEITSLRFDYDSINKINQTQDTMLLVDIIYNKEEEV